MPGGQTILPDLKIVPVKSSEQVMELLTRAAKARACAETLCNDRSSRSHRSFLSLELIRPSFDPLPILYVVCLR